MVRKWISCSLLSWFKCNRYTCTVVRHRLTCQNDEKDPSRRPMACQRATRRHSRSTVACVHEFCVNSVRARGARARDGRGARAAASESEAETPPLSHSEPGVLSRTGRIRVRDGVSRPRRGGGRAGQRRVLLQYARGAGCKGARITRSTHGCTLQRSRTRGCTTSVASIRRGWRRQRCRTWPAQRV